jgi:hypothetical protein
MPHCDFETVLHERARRLEEKRQAMNAGPLRGFRSVAMTIMANSTSSIILPSIYLMGI